MPRNNGYSAAELMAMQRDAAERVRQMQRRARERMSESPPPSPPAAATVPRGEENRPGDLPAGGLQTLLKQFTGDPDRILLLMLLLILSKEDADPALLAALVFLML